MLRILLVILTVLKILSQSIFAQPSIHWMKYYGGNQDDGANCIQQTGDHGFIIVGYSKSYSVGKSDIWLIKTNETGKEEWDRTFGGDEMDFGVSVCQTFDGGFIIGGTTTSFGNGNSDFWLIKTDVNGTEQWNKTFGGQGDDVCGNVCQTSDNGYIISGETDSYGAGEDDIWLIKTDSFGNREWDRTYGGIENDSSGYVQVTYDGGYIISGTTRSYGAGDNDFWLIKTDSKGNKVWDRTFGGQENDESHCVYVTQDNGYVITGETQSFDVAQGDLWLIRTDSLGKKIWSRYYGIPGGGGSVCQTKNGGFIVAGWNSFCAKTYFDIWVLITDADGNRIWSEAYGSDRTSKGYSILQTDDGGIIVAGSIGFESHSDACVIQVDPGITTIKIPSEKTPTCFKVNQNYPNPFNTRTVISYQLPVISNVELSIYNLFGQRIVTLLSERQIAGHYQYTWDVSELPSGIYFYKVATDDFAQMKKLTLLK